MKKKGKVYTAEQKAEIIGYVDTQGFDAAASAYPGITKLLVSNWKRFANPKPSTGTNRGIKPGTVAFAGVSHQELIVENQKLRACLMTLLGE